MSSAHVVLYSTSRFPKISETFVLDEMINLERRGAHIVLAPLIHEIEDQKHPQAVAYEQRAYYCRPWEARVLASHLRRLLRQPVRYLSTVSTLVIGMLRSRDFLPKSLAAFAQAVWFAEVAEAEGASHLHAQWATHPTTAMWVVWRLTGIPFSFTTHAHDSVVDTTFLDRKLRDAAFATPTSNHLRDHLIGIEPSAAAKLHVLRTGIDLSRFHPDQRRPRERFTIVTVARLHPMKGHVHLLDAMVELGRRGYDLDLRLVGGGELYDQITEIVRERGLHERVSVLGNQPREVVVDEIHGAHLHVLPSVVLDTGQTEGLPIALIESMAAGVPSIASGVAGVVELIEDGVSGIILPPGDTGAIVEAIARLHDDPDLAEAISRAGRHRAVEEYDEVATSRRLFDLMFGRTNEEDTAA